MTDRPRVRVIGVNADDATEYVDLEDGAGERQRVPAGPRRLEVRIDLVVLNPSVPVFEELRKLVGLEVDLTARPPAHPAL